MSEDKLPEPWLRGTLIDVPAVSRAVLHALELAHEEAHKCCGSLSNEQLNARPGGIASVAFHLRHIARSTDRLLTYAEGRTLDAAQTAAMKAELEAGATGAELFTELSGSLQNAARRIRELGSGNLEGSRDVGSRKLPTTLGGLLVHVADHTQRHVGQAITTAKIVASGRRP